VFSPDSAITIDLNATTAGRRAIAGFLLQILRRINLGLEMSLTLTPIDDGAQMTLHLEPAEGNDHQVVGGPRDIVEQVKMRKVGGKWTTGEAASKVLPDLLKAVQPAIEQPFRFVTNNANGLGRLQAYIASRGRPGQRQRWGKASLSRPDFEQLLAKSAGLPTVTPELQHLLNNIEIEIIDVVATEDDIDAALRPLLRPGQNAGDKRFQLVGQLMTLASHGASLSPANFHKLISPEAHRLLAHIQSLPALTARHVEEDAQLIGYVPKEQGVGPAGPRCAKSRDCYLPQRSLRLIGLHDLPPHLAEARLASNQLVQGSGIGDVTILHEDDDVEPRQQMQAVD
jgi:hypothetical protein